MASRNWRKGNGELLINRHTFSITLNKLYGSAVQHCQSRVNSSALYTQTSVERVGLMLCSYHDKIK